jgi:type IV fimbrial biogenesis protein FimT
MNTRMHGFTLLELMMVVVVAGVLLGIGVPAMGNLIRNSRMTGSANDVMAALHFARSEAIKRRVPVTVCTSADPQAADPVCDATDVLTGWLVFVDTNGNGQRDAAELLLNQHAPLPDTISARGTADPLRIIYLDTGFAQDTAGSQLVLCDERGNVPSSGALSAARGITISATGRAGVTREPDQIAGLIADVGGTIGGCG